LEKKVYLYAEEAMIEVDEEAKEGVANFVSECVKSYEKRIGFPLLKDLGAFKVRYDGLMTWAIVFLVLAALGLCFLLKRQEKLYSTVFSRVSSAFFGSSLVFAVPSALILLSGVVMRIGIANRSFYYFLTTYATIFFSYVLVSGLILISLGIFFGLLSWRLQSDARKRIEAKEKSE
jgi:small-conductance mechanosensitive channel